MTSRYVPVFFDIETTGLNPMAQHFWSDTQAAEVTGVAIGVIWDWTDDGEDRSLTTIMNDSGSEYRTIELVNDEFDAIQSGMDDRDKVPFLVGHNIYQFDVMYWSARCSRYRFDAWPVGYGWRRLDTMRALSLPSDADGGPKQFPGQQDYADYLGIDYLDELEGSQMPEAFERGDYDLIEAHVEDDVSTLMDIFMEEREDMVSEFWGHYKNHDSQPLDENPPDFTDTVDIGFDE